MYLRLAVGGFSRYVRNLLAGQCVHQPQLSGYLLDSRKRSDAVRFAHVSGLPMRWLPFCLALLCARPALAALTLDSTTCSAGAIANCPKEHMTQANCTLANNTEMCTSTVPIGAVGPNTLLIAAVSLRYFSGQATSITGMSVGMAANYTTQWTLVPNSPIADSEGASATFYAVTARAFTGEVPKVNIGCGTSGCPNFEVHAQVIGWSASKLTPGNAAAGSSSSGTPSLTIKNTQFGSQVVFEGRDDSGLNCSQTPTANATNIDTWQPRTPCSGSDFYSSEWLTSPTISTGGNVTIGLTAPSNVRGTWTAVEVCDSTAPSCPAGPGFVLSGIASPRTAGASSSVTVKAIDAAGNQSTGYRGTVHFTSTDALATLPANYTFQSTDQGIHTFTGLILKSAGTQSVTATDTVTTSITGTLGGIQVNAAVASALTVSGFPSPSTAGAAATVTVTARDAYGNVAAGYTGTVTVTSSDAQASPATHAFTTTDAGSYGFSFTLKTAGTQSITASDGTLSASQTGISVVAAGAATLSLSGIASPITAGTAATITVQAKDAYGNLATSYAGTVRFTSSDAQAGVPANFSFSGSGGTHTFTNGVTLRTAGTQSVTAADISVQSITGQQAGISVRAAGATSLTVTGTVAATAGVATQATVTLHDPYGNVAAGYLGTIHFISSDPLATLPADRTFAPADAGSATVTGLTFRTAGTQSLTATDTLSPSLTGTESGIPVAPGAAASLAVSGFPSPSTAGVSGALTVKALDTWSNIATGYRGTVSFSSTDAAAVLPGPTTFTSTDAGARAFVATLKTSGTQGITANDGTLSGSQTGISVVASPAATLVVSGVTSPIGAGVLSSAIIAAKDAYGNTASSYRGTVAFTSSDAQAVLASPYTFAASDSGIHTVSNAVQFKTVGTQSLTATDTVNAAITGTESGISVGDTTPPVWPAGSTLTATATSTSTAHLVWTAATDDVAVTAYKLYQNGTLAQTLGNTLATDVSGLTMGVTASFQVQAGDAAGNWTTNGPTASVTTLPPDPKLIAPPIDQTVASTVGNSTSFLYTGPNAIQVGVAAGTIQPSRAVVMRGTIRDRSGQPVTGVNVSVVSHPEYGNTWSRSDGMYDLAVNGGGTLVVAFNKSGYLYAERHVGAGWQVYAQVPDVVLVPLDPQTTLIDLTNTSTVQVASGSVTNDEMGSRQTSIFFLPGTQASLVMPNGSSQSVSTLHVHATEFTIGSTGPQAMPATLPATSAYTYAVDFSADEAIAAGAQSVQFSQTVYWYVQNFLAFPTGAVIPNGYYDRTKNAWLPMPNGRVINITGVSGGLAQVDTVGSTGNAPLSISNSELQQLASRYSPGQSLWRIPLQHFSDDDGNGQEGPVPDAGPPDAGPPDQPKHPDDPCKAGGSIIECQTQDLGEQIEVVGTPYSLNYRASRQIGRRANYRLNLPVPATTAVAMPNGYACYPSPGRNPPCQNQTSTSVGVSSYVQVQIAGRMFSKQNVAPAPPSSPLPAYIWSFEWDGLDAYGRRLQGEQLVNVRACYTYPLIVYADSSDAGAAFAAISGTGAMLSWRSGSYSLDLCTEWNGKLGGWDDKARALGGWTLSAHHAYDTQAQTLYRGDGERSSGSDRSRLVSNTIVGNGNGTPAISVGATATAVALGGVNQGLATGADGSVYFASNSDIWKMTAAGTIVAHIATQANPIYGNVALALGPDGLLYFIDAGNGSFHFNLWRVEANGSMTLLYTLPYSNIYASMAIDRDGSIYFSDQPHQRVLKRSPDGTVRTVAGMDGLDINGGAFAGDGGLATRARLNGPLGLAIGADGTLYIADTQNYRVRAVGPDGNIKTVAGSGAVPGFFGPDDTYSADGGQAILAGVYQPVGVAVAHDRTLYIAAGRVRRVTPDGIISTIANSDPHFLTCQQPGTKDCLPLYLYGVISPQSVVLTATGALLVATGDNFIRNISPGFTPAQSISEMYIASADASEVYVFDLSGKHLRTLDALTTAITQQFGYDFGGRLTSITDRASNVTTIQRDGQGNPTTIVGPYGQSTPLSLDGNGYLATITNPNNERTSLQYLPPVSGDVHTGGLLSQLTDARMGVHAMQYDSDGFLTKDTRPDNSSETLSRSGNLSPANVTRTTALGRTTSYAVSWNFAGDVETSSVKDPAGLSTTTVTQADHSSTITYPDGTTVTTTTAPDPRFGMDAFSVSSTTKTPSGLTRTASTTRSATMASPTDPLTLQTLLEQVTVNGRTFQSSYNGPSRRMTLTSAVGRVTTMGYDSLGRVVAIAPPGVQAIQLHYDSRGRNDTITQGTRVTTMAYDASGFLHSILDPAQHTTLFGYDLAGRPTSETLPDTNVIGMGYDGNGNVTSVTPPSRPAHAFAFTPADLESDYTPPVISQPATTHTTYNLDQQVSNVSRPDGDHITPTYDNTNGRLTALATSRGANSYGYSPTTGQLTGITTFDGVGLTYGYDGSLLQDITWSGPISGNVHKTYDSSFRLASESVTGGQSINFGYDNDDLLTSAGAMSITRDPTTGFVTGTTLGAISESHTYDAFGAEQTYTVTANGNTLYSANYGTRDALGRIVNKTETIQGTTHVYGYTYDANGRLTDVTTDGNATSHYEYDANGNRLVGPGLTASPVYDSQDRLLSYGNCSYTYKADGSLQTKTCPDGTTTYDYDAFGNLRGVTLPNGTAITYLIDGRNRRLGKKVNASLVEGFLYSEDLRRVGWYDGTGTLKAQFVFDSRGPAVMIKAGMAYRLISDQVGSVRLVVDTNGAIAERLDYDAFGNVITDSSPDFQPLGFEAGLLDRDVGFTRFGARDYDPVPGRWTVRDPILFAGRQGSLYAFVGSDPINRVDEAGLQTAPCTPMDSTVSCCLKMHPEETQRCTGVENDQNFWIAKKECDTYYEQCLDAAKNKCPGNGPFDSAERWALDFACNIAYQTCLRGIF